MRSQDRIHRRAGQEGTGRFRVVAGAATSEPVLVTEILGPTPTPSPTPTPTGSPTPSPTPTTSPSPSPSPPVETNAFRLGATQANPSRVLSGSPVSLSAPFDVWMSDGTLRPGPAGVSATLQVKRSAGWATAVRVNTAVGSVRAGVRVEASATYRFVLEDGTSSRPVTIAVKSSSPDDLNVQWPTRVVNAFKVKVSVMSDGRKWRPKTNVVLENRPSGERKWVTLDEGTTRRGVVRLSTQQLSAGTWRVRVPSHGLKDSRTYGAR